MARDNKGFACHQHRHMVSYEIHHVWPQCYHGPSTPDNMVKICPNAHSDIHYLMERMFRGKPVAMAEYGPAVRQLAKDGYRQVIAYAEEIAAKEVQKIYDRH